MIKSLGDQQLYKLSHFRLFNFILTRLLSEDTSLFIFDYRENVTFYGDGLCGVTKLLTIHAFITVVFGLVSIFDCFRSPVLGVTFFCLDLGS